MKTESPGVLSGSMWWRFDEYEVVDGTHIAPAEGAELERYDPVEEHRQLWEGRSQDDEPAYVKLARVDPYSIDAILNWCSQFGLLGILPHRTLEIHFWPRWGGIHSIRGGGGRPGQVGVTGGGFLGSARVIAQESYLWGAGGGLNETTASARLPPDMSEERGALKTEDEGKKNRPRSDKDTEDTERMEGPDAPIVVGPPEPGTLLTREQVEELGRMILTFSEHQPVVRPGARIRPIHSDVVRSVDFAEGYAQFFPRRKHVTAWVAANHGTWADSQVEFNVFWGDKKEEAQLELEQAEYPWPGEEEFLQEYGEPIPLVRRYLWQVRAAYDVWQKAKETETYDDLQEVLKASGPDTGGRPFDEFRASLRGVSPYAGPEPYGDGFTWPLKWQVPSLYAGLSLMMYQDFAQRGAYARQCRECGQPFASRRSEKKYCSDQCGNRYRVRKHREETSN